MICGFVYFSPPREGLDSKATIRIDDKTFEVEANDLEHICVLGRGAYGVVEKVRHRITNTIMAVKVRLKNLLKTPNNQTTSVKRPHLSLRRLYQQGQINNMTTFNICNKNISVRSDLL